MFSCIIALITICFFVVFLIYMPGFSTIIYIVQYIIFYNIAKSLIYEFNLVSY